MRGDLVKIVDEKTGENRKCCGSCKYNIYSNLEGAWECINSESEGYGLLTANGDSCSDWSAKSG